MSSSKGSILLCDDDRLVLATLSEGLTNFGFSVISCDNGDDAILLARKSRPDLALLDLYMQGKSGMDVAGYFRDVLGIPFMFFSAHSQASTVKEAIELGALGYLVKPLEVKQIVPELELAVARARSEAKAAAASGDRGARQVGAAQNDVQMRSIAQGLLMERFKLSGGRAIEKLEALAALNRKSIYEAANDLVLDAESRFGNTGS
jgi:two-component system, response regulator PdtaR